ncbi:MAG: PAS domain-containing protein, partial [Alphaproteobacteria bacterium]|nr:PAS domain-containing protein [Alphaproteobacteria bacterium]
MPLVALALALPTVAVLAVLVAARRLDPVAALCGAVAVLVALAVGMIPFVTSLTAVQDAMAALGADGDIGAEVAIQRRLRRTVPAVTALWQAALRLARGWRERAARAEAALAAAEAVFAAIPDPEILLDAQRRVLRANRAAAMLVGTVAEGADLAALLRNPAVLAATDAVLAGETARVVEFSLSVA